MPEVRLHQLGTAIFYPLRKDIVSEMKANLSGPSLNQDQDGSKEKTPEKN